MNFPKIPNLDATGVLFALLPGLLAFLVVRSLTARDKPLETNEIVLHSLAYTLSVNAIWSLLCIASWFPTPNVVGLCLTAIGFAICLARLINTGTGYKLLAKMKITKESPWPTVWESVFRNAYNEIGEWATIELKDGRRILGAIRYFSSSPKDGHVAIDQARWLLDNNEQLISPGLLVFRGDDIEIIQFMPKDYISDSTTSTESNP